MMRITSLCMVLAMLTVGSDFAEGRDRFLAGSKKPHHGSTEEDFRAAMGAIVGCGGHFAEERLATLDSALKPIWNILPKNQNNMMDWRMVRYMIHRHFHQKSHLLLRGFEPMKQVDTAGFGKSGILAQNLPSIDNGKEYDSSKGFSLAGVVTMAATIEHLIEDAGEALLHTVYDQQEMSENERMDVHKMALLVEYYLVNWMLGDDRENIAIVLDDFANIREYFDKWDSLLRLVEGAVKAMQFGQRTRPKAGDAMAVLKGEYSRADVHDVVKRVTSEFGIYWESECQSIKDSLANSDAGSGRVSLQQFYSANAAGDWRFSESEDYLRHVGALDESSSWQGKRVIISNYVQGPNNCVVAADNYLVCCAHECDRLLAELEDAVGASFATPDEILGVVSNMTDIDDQPPKLTRNLRGQLVSIAGVHSGKIPLHGRLFAQWLHFLFPRDCPYPHKKGVASAETPMEFDREYAIAPEAVAAYVSDGSKSPITEAEYEEVASVGQWSNEEELLSEYPWHANQPWFVGQTFASICGLLIVVLGVLKVSTSAGEKSPLVVLGVSLGAGEKSHLV